MIMIAKTRVCSVSSVQLSENLRDRGDVLFLVRNIIASEEEHLGFKAVRDLHRTFDVFEICERTVVNVGKVNDPEPIKLFRESRESYLYAF